MLQGCLSPEIIRDYPKVRVSLFASVTDTNDAFSFSHVANQPDGYVTELQKCAQSSTAMGTEALIPEPYSTRLMPVSDMSEVLAAATGVLLESIEFVGYDGTLVGSSDQNADNNTAIDSSQSSALDAYMASHFRGGIVGNWQPNYCRPVVRVNGMSVLDMMGSEIQDAATLQRNHLGHLSIGIPLPFGLEYYREFDRVTKVEVYGGLAQWIATSAEATKKLVRYPLVCMIRWRLK
ncbi:MAG: hypothetical protein JSS89_12230 [Bacteroidetes bacterium]|nr:hypothetical protein [Bacteroidota bacterium]